VNAAVHAFVGLGSNLGDAAATLRLALESLDRLPATRLLRASRLYRTPAWGNTEQPDFVNAVALLHTSLDARALLDGLLGIERSFGRVRRERWGPRVLDLDLLLHGDSVIDEPGLHVPHPHLTERAFVLLPLLEIDPDVVVPGHGRAQAALATLAYEGIEAVR
jgi:2-amino-4-hydroxy-6-hydroxymethyldihydropteridine diphosphokinase